MATSDFIFALAFFPAFGCAAVGGVFFAFSAFVMGALARLPAPEGIAAMRSINVAAVSFAFMAALFGTAAACLGLMAWAVVSLDGWAMASTLADGALYLVGAIGVTIIFNVPLNDALAGLDPKSLDAKALWEDEYLAKGTAWSHVRTIASLAASAMLAIAPHMG